MTAPAQALASTTWLDSVRKVSLTTHTLKFQARRRESKIDKLDKGCVITFTQGYRICHKKDDIYHSSKVKKEDLLFRHKRTKNTYRMLVCQF